MRKTIRIAATAAFAICLLFGLTGCTFSYQFEVAGVVRAPDGSPLSEVKVVLRGYILNSEFPVVTGPDGRFLASFRVPDSDFMGDKPLPVWSFTLSKDGYRTSIIVISLKEKPVSTGTTTHIPVEWVLEKNDPAIATDRK